MAPDEVSVEVRLGAAREHSTLAYEAVSDENPALANLLEEVAV